ncbi:hypothetical protein [Streptomyces sp. B1I3]|uniref:hypothetical protein n=1 Tax=Streptomyces sp. B1I3 TaxID=3042264 RepID=UPI00277F3C0B|nr:hypothetical protein [Streptomyces sp. B1I3]MDQ0791630.1 hypothetical protein [Streptomyces sp. B1I3]
MMRSLRMAAVAMGAVAMLGSSAVAQAADTPPAGTITYAYTSGTPSPKDIVMNWRGTCTNPGQELHFVAQGTNWGGSDDNVKCQVDGTYWASIMIYDYDDRGMKYGQSFDYQAMLMSMNEPFVASTSTGTATL